MSPDVRECPSMRAFQRSVNPYVVGSRPTPGTGSCWLPPRCSHPPAGVLLRGTVVGAPVVGFRPILGGRVATRDPPRVSLPHEGSPAFALGEPWGIGPHRDAVGWPTRRGGARLRAGRLPGARALSRRLPEYGYDVTHRSERGTISIANAIRSITARSPGSRFASSSSSISSRTTASCFQFERSISEPSLS